MPPDDIDELSHAELKGLVVKQWEQIVELQRLVVALRDEIARFNGQCWRQRSPPGRPSRSSFASPRGDESPQ
jgi:hypothetical protein